MERLKYVFQHYMQKLKEENGNEAFPMAGIRAWKLQEAMRI